MSRVRRTFTFQGKRYFAEGRNLEEAIANRERMKLELEYGLYKPKSMIVADLGELWLEVNYKAHPVTEKTYKQKAQILRTKINPIIGGMRINDVTQFHILMVLNEIADNYTTNHVNIALSILRSMFRVAVASNQCTTNPCTDIEKPIGKKVNIRREATVIERNVYAGHLVWLDMVLMCGLRPGETAYVKFSDIHDGYMKVEGTKTHNADRFVPLPDVLRDRILMLPHKFNNELVCSMRDNKRSKQWLRLKKEIGLPESDLVPYCFRHSYVTDLENCPGLSQAAIKKIVGHAIEGVTDIYTHPRIETCLEALPQIESYWESIGIRFNAHSKSVTNVTQCVTNGGKWGQ